MRKRLLSLFVLACMILSLTACGFDKAWFRNGTEEYEINYEEGTVIINYLPEFEPIRFTLTQNGNVYRCDITYPDGSTYWEKQTKNKDSDSVVFITQWQEGVNYGYGKGYVYQSLPPHDVADAIIENAPGSTINISFGRIALAIVLAAIGIWQMSSPASAWHWNYGWRFKNAEPSELSLAMGQASGSIMLVLAIILLFSSCAG